MTHEIEVGGRRAGKTKRMEGFQKPLVDNTDTKTVGLAMISQPEVGLIVCSCGWRFIHARNKVREDRAETHVKAKHNGQAVWL